MSSIHYVSLGYIVTLFTVIGWGAVCWEAQLAAEAGNATRPAPVTVAAMK